MRARSAAISAAIMMALAAAVPAAAQRWPELTCTVSKSDNPVLGLYNEPANHKTRVIGGNPQTTKIHKTSDGYDMTKEFCAAYCWDKGFGGGSFYGVEAGKECYCAHSITPHSTKAEDGAKTQACVGDPSQQCGGNWVVDVFQASCHEEPTSDSVRGCMARCAHAGHCCVGASSAYKHPSCTQGCIAADREAHGKGSEPGVKLPPEEAVAKCKQVCKDNDGNTGAKNNCGWKTKGYDDMTNCFSCPKKPKWAEGGGGECGQDGTGGVECMEGCTYYFDPANPVCAEGHKDMACVDSASAPALRHGVALGESGDTCDKQTCTNWEQCSVWCQDKDKHGCCSFDGQKQCTFFANHGAPKMQVSGTQASLCSPFTPSFGGGKSGGVTGGGVFLILFFVGGFTYFAAGFAYNMRKKELHGIPHRDFPIVEAVPNREFWADLPALIKDGATYSVGKVRGVVDRGYQTV